MIVSKKQYFILFALAVVFLFVLHVKLSEITRLEAEVDDLKRRNHLLKLNINENEDVLKYSNIATPGLPSQIQLPNIIDIYPHLNGKVDWDSLNPALRYPNITLPKKQLIIGVPTVQRHNVSYLVPSLKQLFEKARTEDLEKMRIIVMISDLKGASSPFVQETLTTLKEHFMEYFESRLLQVMVPPAAWYPNISQIPPNLNDTADRMYWRTKQNLDFAYLMIYAARMGDLYLQLEDDIEVALEYTGTLFKYAEQRDWFIVELSALGFIGRLMRSNDVTQLAVTILMHYQSKPVDWLLDNHCTNRFCSHGMSHDNCVEELGKHRLRVKPAMFQHMGYHSSLKGKIMNAKDKTFKSHGEKRV